MWDTIRRLVSTGSTVLLTTQYLDEADQLADRIAVIDRGKVVAEGTTSELKSSIGTASLKLKLVSPDTTHRTIALIKNVLGVKSISTKVSEITAPMADPEKITDLLLELRKENIHLAEVSVQEPTLDEVFLAITGKKTKPTKNKGDE
jgi:ABC-2 type transport system ATP-binding protein